MTAPSLSPARAGWPPLAALLMWLYTGIGYGLVISLNRIIATEGIPFTAYVFWQSLLGGAALLIVAGLRGVRPGLSFLHLRAYAGLGIVGLSAPYLVLALAAPRLPAGIIALCLAFTPMITYAMTLALGMERFRRARLLGMALGLGGVLLIVLPETSLPAAEMALWVVAVLAAPLGFAASYIVGARWRPPASDPVALAAGLLLTGALFALPFMAANGEWWVFSAPFTRGQGAVLLAALLVMLMWVFLFEVLRLAGPVFYSTVTYLETLAGIGFGMALFGEHHSAWIWAALGLTIGGLYLVNRRAGAAPAKAGPSPA